MVAPVIPAAFAGLFAARIINRRPCQLQRMPSVDGLISAHWAGALCDWIAYASHKPERPGDPSQTTQANA